MGLKEKRATEVTEGRKETGVQSGQRGNLASAPAPEVERVERRYDVKAFLYEDNVI